ncbi:hypothetical protein NP493_490g01042 [Ridgeia piscesae]|uniref:Uncharacterized protein n=1 Tax=Ridgeia piscesae TaxID=27915 RepID=A0AAD9KY35_RIDPI|nr:hypothetical protein NP493_490g01042 [Ridgeia piscesae]
MYLISTHSSRLDQSISVAALDTTANILTAVSTTGRMTRQEARQVVSTSTQAIERILQTELSTTVLGEEPFIKTSPKLSVSAGRFKTSVLPPTLIETAYFKLPHNMKDVMKRKVKRMSERQEKVAVDEDCYEAHTVVFADNLYSFGQRNDNSVSG